MNLCEEYCKRHDLRCPVIKRADNRLHMIFRADVNTWLTHWLVFQISVHPESYHPAYYNFTWLVPQHNGCFQSGPFQNLANPMRVDWDNYDLEIIKAAQRDDGIVPIGDLGEAKLAAWEIFLYCADERLPKLPIDMRCLICDSIDPQKSIEQRMASQQQVIDYLASTGSNLYTRWEGLRQYCDPAAYAGWLADLVYQMRDPEYRKEFSDMQSVA